MPAASVEAFSVFSCNKYKRAKAPGLILFQQFMQKF
jgi:hypothetical protein